MPGKDLEELANSWKTKLQLQTKEFDQYANEVGVWDRTLMENSEKINFLYNKVTAAHTTQASVDESLKHIEEQQAALLRTLEHYEKEANRITENTNLNELGPADRERDNSYGLATNLNSQLDGISQSLASMIESVNKFGPNTSEAASTPFGGDEGGDPIAQIEAILNAHLGSLQWIDGAVKELTGKVEEVEAVAADSVSSASGEPYRGFGLGPVR